MRRRSLAVALAIVAVGAPVAVADELRLESGEVVHAAVVQEDEVRLVVEVAGKRRRLKRSNVAERIEAEPPAEALRRREAALEPGDAEGRAELALFAWSRRLDQDAERLAHAAVAVDADCVAAQRHLGRVVRDDEWVAGWPAPWAPVGRTGPRWSASGAAPRGTQRRAARRALDWLAAHQDEDGRVDADGFYEHCPEGDVCGDPGGGHHGERVRCPYDGATTAVAVMAWLADGSTLSSGPYAEALRRGARFLRDEGLGGWGFDAVWNVAFATQALADACAATRDPALRPVVTSAVERLCSAQRADGGWSYVYSIGDVPTTGVVLVALGHAAQAGVGVDPERVERGLAFLEARVEAKTGRSEYHDRAERKGYTPTTANAAATLAARAHLGVLPKTPALGRRIGAITGKKPRWKISFEEVETRDGRTVRAQVGNLYPYAWYVTCLAVAERGGATWTSWGRSLRSALAAGQVEEGHAAGSWDPLGPYSTSGGRAFVTGLCALMLQAEYRYPRSR